MKKICLFTKGHNGDIVHSKSFVQDIANQTQVPCLYHHLNHPKVSQDSSTIKTPIYPGDYYEKFVENKNILFVNIWLWPYIIDRDFIDVNVETNYYMFSKIYERINQFLGTNIKLKNIEEYLPYIDFDFVEKNNINNFVNIHSNKRVLLSNGPCLSGQSKYNDDMSDFIEDLSIQYPSIDFIATQKFNTEQENIYFTDDIIQSNECDLNEIGYLSTFCDLIIGKNSGPFCFCTIKQNYNNPNKIFFAFGHNKTDCFHGNVEIKSKFIFNSSENKDSICSSINQTISENLL
jgi:hypothetical protein